MFSSMTIASSTTRPTASTSASRVSVLIEKPNTHISVKAPISETGMVTIGIRVARRMTQEDEDHEDDEHDRLADGMEHVVDRRSR